MARLDLPTKEFDLVDALDAELIPAEQEAMVHSVSHKIVDAYLAGIRKFRVLDRWAGNLSIAFENSKGELNMRYEEVVRAYLNEMGRFMKMEIGPVATKKGESLGALRKGSIANAMLGALSAPLPLNLIKRQMIIPFLKHGTVGLNHIETGLAHQPDMLEIVPARQLRGMPAWVDGVGNLMGIARKRWVPLGWLKTRLKEVYGKELDTRNAESDLNAQSVPWGGVPPDQAQHHTYGQGHQSTGGVQQFQRSDLIGTNISGFNKDNQDAGGPKKDGRMYVPLEEIYIYDDSGVFISNFIIKVGRKVPFQEDFEKNKVQVLSPLHIARHTDIGKMFARGFVSPLIPLNDQIEKMLTSLFKNVAELDMFGTLFVPGSSGIDIKRWKTGPRPRVETFEPDPISPNLQPMVLQPVTSGKLPAQVAEIAGEAMEKMTGQGPIFQGQTSGRVDSAAGLGFLFNTANIGLALPANGLAEAFAGVYSRMLQAAKDRIGPGQAIEIATIDDAIAGVIIDPQTGQLKLADNPIPDPWLVNVDIRDRAPKDREVRKQELKELFGMQLVDRTRFWISALEENLDMPGAPKELWETWRKATWQIIMLFRDGETPGDVDVGEHTQNPDIQLLKVQEFMNKIEYSLASEAVRDKFETWKIDLETLAGIRFPSALPPPDEVAAQEAAGGQQRAGVPQLNIPPGIAPGVQ